MPTRRKRKRPSNRFRPSARAFRSEVALRDHRLVVDEPESLGGTDSGPNPVELILAALGTCQEITYRAYAAALAIPLEHVSVTLEGDIDLRGFFAVDESVQAGISETARHGARRLVGR